MSVDKVNLVFREYVEQVAQLDQKVKEVALVQKVVLDHKGVKVIQVIKVIV